MEIKIVFKKDEELKKEKSKAKEIKSLKDLRAIMAEENPRFSYGGVEFGALPSEQEEEGDEDEMENDVTEGRNEGEQGDTPDDKAMSEDPEKRTKNSKHPTIVGKKMA
jgi:hypothetical protein